MQQLSKEWFDARREKMTGSIAGAALGFAPYRTAEDVMRSMVREYLNAESEFIGNVATEYGSHNEEGAGIEYTMETGLVITPCGFIQHPEIEWLGASPDGLIGEYGMIEIKCPYGQAKKNPPAFKTLDDQMHYKIQVIIELACTGRQWCDFYQWSPNGTALERLYWDDVEYYFKTELVPALEEFYKRYLIEREMPNAAAYLEPKRVEINSIEAHKLVVEYHELTDSIDMAKDKQKEILNQLIIMSDGKNADVFGTKLTKVERVGAISYSKAVKELFPGANLEEWRGKPTTFWKLG